jgi:hypothetical protein
MNIVVGFLECEGFDAIWVVVDRLSQMRHFIPCHTTIDALGLAEMFLQEVVHLHGGPLTIILGQGTQFTSTIWGTNSDHLGIDCRLSTAFHAQTDAQRDRMNATMEQDLRVYVNHQPDDWVMWLPLAEIVVNNGTSE